MGPSRSKRARTKPPLQQQPVSSSHADSTTEAPAEGGSSTPAEKSNLTEDDSNIRNKSAPSVKPSKAEDSGNKQVSHVATAV